MPFKYRAITANCGTDVLGPKAYEVIAKSLREDQADFYILNCQEIKYIKTLEQLKKSVGNDYSVSMVGTMNTHTKGLSTGQGMASYVIHKKDIQVTVQSTEAARRSSLLFGTSAYNKGGLITNLTLASQDDRIHIQTVSGHLDSTNIQHRAQDWLVIHTALAKPALTWEALAAMTPHLRVTGYDANTRNKLGEDNLWLSSNKAFEIQGMQQAIFESQRFTHESTYKTHLGSRLTREDKKRPGYMQGGSLDFVGIADGREHVGLDTNVMVVSTDLETIRDHDVLITPLKIYEPLPDFDKVKGQMAIRLATAAPALAKEIKHLTDTPDSRQQLVAIYQQFLSQNGLLNKELELFKLKLGTIEQLSAVKLPTWMMDLIQDTLFRMSPWFELSSLDNLHIEEIKTKQKDMQQLLNHLNQSRTFEQIRDCLIGVQGFGTSLEDASTISASRVRMHRFRGQSKSTLSDTTTTSELDSISSSLTPSDDEDNEFDHQVVQKKPS